MENPAVYESYRPQTAAKKGQSTLSSDIDETIQGLFYSLLERHGRQDLEESIKVAILCLIMAMDYIISVII